MTGSARRSRIGGTSRHALIWFRISAPCSRLTILTSSARFCPGRARRSPCSRRRDFARVERLLQATCEAAGSPVTVRTLAAHQQTNQ